MATGNGKSAAEIKPRFWIGWQHGNHPSDIKNKFTDDSIVSCCFQDG